MTILDDISSAVAEISGAHREVFRPPNTRRSHPQGEIHHVDVVGWWFDAPPQEKTRAGPDRLSDLEDQEDAEGLRESATTRYLADDVLEP